MGEQLCDLEITEERVLGELERLRDDKAAGANDLVPRLLNKIKWDISYPLTLLFQRIMGNREVSNEWKTNGNHLCPIKWHEYQ